MSQKLALIIGNSAYEDGSLAQLVTPDVDVNALAAVLRDPAIGGFDEVTAVVNQDSTAIRRAISSFFVGRGRDDLLLLYFSGHGVRDDRGQLFLAVRDTEHTLLRGTAIPAAFITEEMNNSRSRRQVLILDCCHSGAFTQGMKGAPGASVGTAAAFEGTGFGRVVLTATDSTQYAWEGDRVVGQAENSVFTRYLIQGLLTGQADSDGDGQITLDELYNYVYEQVVYETPRQTPGKWSYGQQGEIVLARNPRPAVKPAELPPDLQQSLDDPRPWVREGAVQELDRILQGSHAGLALAAYQALKQLAADDSRRVASAASGSLEAHGGAFQPRDEAESRPTPTTPEQRATAGIIETGGPALEMAAPKGEARTAVLSRVAGGEKVWMPVVIAALGWALGFGITAAIAIALNNGSPLFGALVGVIIAIFTGLALWGTAVRKHWKQGLLMAAGLAFCIYLNWGPDSPLDPFLQSLGANGNSSLLWVDSGLLVGGLAGVVTALALRWAEPSLHTKQVAFIALGWSVAVGIGNAIFVTNSGSSTSLPWLTGVAALMGAIGNTIMFATVNAARRKKLSG